MTVRPVGNNSGSIVTLEEDEMAQIYPWHSIKADVHHNNTECNNGKNIQPEDRRAGTGDKPLCEECSNLNLSGAD